jgi:hypothetical protein
MSPPEKLYRLEIEFHRRLRTLPAGIIDADSLHFYDRVNEPRHQLVMSRGQVRSIPRRSRRSAVRGCTAR